MRNVEVSSVHRRWTRRLAGLTSLVFMLAACGATDLAGPGGRDGVWQSADIGSTDIAGVTREVAPGELQILAAGEDIWDEADTFRYVYREIQGGGSLTVRVNDLTAADEWTKVGLMVRENLAPNARNAMILLTDYNGVLFQRRDVTGGMTADVLPDGTYMRDGSASAPWWLRIERKGSQIIGSHSADGQNWRELGRVTIDLPQNALIGMAVSSVKAGELASGTYTSIEVRSDGAPLPTPPKLSEPTPAPNPGPSNEATYQIDRTTDFMNPERGFHGSADLLGGGSMSGVRNAGMTLARSYVRLDNYRNGPLPESLLTDLRKGFEQARRAGIKVLPRFTYNFGPDPDAPLDVVLTHIGQLKPILTEYSDVIATLQAGFIGAWGEWHHSTNGLTSDSAVRTVADALLNAIPESRMVQIRTPARIRTVVGSPSPSTIPFGPEPQARIGFVNDCFLASPSDVGTYSGDQVQDRAEAATLSRYTVTGGETCSVGQPSPRNGCVTALAELAQFHWDYINSSYYKGILDTWRNEGCFDEISRRLGYRLGLIKGSVTKTVTAGETLTVTLSMENSGFGKVYNPRPAELVLRNTETGQAYTLRASDDIRRLLPVAGETKSVQLNVAVPGTIAKGSYRVYLRLPDAASNLADDTRYDIRLANVGTWDASTGLNDLKLTTTVGGL